MRLLTIALVALAAGILLVVLAIRTVENRLIFFPPRYPDGFLPQSASDVEVEDVWLHTADGVKINAFYHSHPGSKQVLLWFHGNAENIGYGLGQMKTLASLGLNILAVDYRGYGRSEGHPSEAGVYRDADAAYEYLLHERHFPPEGIIIYGHSLGGAVAINLASRRPCGALIVQSSFTTVRDMARQMFAVPLIAYAASSRFDSLDRIRRVSAPVLIVHGTQDDVVPFAMGEQLFAAARQPKHFFAVEGAGHNDVLETGGESYLACLRTLVAALPHGGRS